jgi:hypothetical protein
MNKDKEYIKVCFRDMSKVNSSIKKYLKIKDDSITDLASYDDRKFEDILLKQIQEATNKIWNDKHKSKEFMPNTGDKNDNTLL